MTLSVAKLARRVGLSPDAVRYYEKEGLIPEPARSHAGYRLYDEHLAERLNFIKGAQQTGLKLRQISELLEVIDRGLCPCGHAESLVDQRIAEIDTELRQLRGIRKQLLALKDRLPGPAACPDDAGPWPCERTFIEVGTKTGRRSGHGKATG